MAFSFKFLSCVIVPRHPPTNVECYNASSTILVVQWQAASMQGMGGSFIRGYEVFFKPRAITPPKWNTILACNSTFKTSAVELEKYTEYEIQVTAFNGEGSGNYSEIVHCFTDEDGEQGAARFCFCFFLLLLLLLFLSLFCFSFLPLLEVSLQCSFSAPSV